MTDTPQAGTQPGMPASDWENQGNGSVPGFPAQTYNATESDAAIAAGTNEAFDSAAFAAEDADGSVLNFAPAGVSLQKENFSFPKTPVEMEQENIPTKDDIASALAEAQAKAQAEAEQAEQARIAAAAAQAREHAAQSAAQAAARAAAQQQEAAAAQAAQTVPASPASSQETAATVAETPLEAANASSFDTSAFDSSAPNSPAFNSQTYMSPLDTPADNTNQENYFMNNTQDSQANAPTQQMDAIPAANNAPVRKKPVFDFVVPEGNEGDDTVTDERRKKAKLVAETLMTEHPEIERDLVIAMTQLVLHNSSDMHLVVGAQPMLRTDGKIGPVPGTSKWNKDNTWEAVKVMTSEEDRHRFETDLELDVSFAIGDLLRFRVNVYHDRLGVALALRTIPMEIKTAQQLGLDASITNLALEPRGLVLVCGPTGSGKSTTLAAIVDRANQERHDHIITIEDPIEFVHQHKNCVMSQREVGTDTKSFAEALKRALREDPDIIEVGELRDLETISTAITAVETGHLVFATLHTQDAASTVDRMIDVFPENQQQQVRIQVASTLKAVIIQTLVPRATGHGRAPATEVMYNTAAISALIRSGKIHQVRTQLQAGGDLGMHTLDQDLARLVNSGTIKYEDALKKVQILDEFNKLVGAR